MKAILCREVPIKHFIGDIRLKQLTAFASDLPSGWLSQVWDDACDVGLKVKGNSTRLFILIREDHRDGELVAWHLGEYSHLKPEVGLWIMTVFND